MFVDGYDFPSEILGASQQETGASFGKFRDIKGMSELIDGYKFDDTLSRLAGLLYEPDLHSNLISTEYMIHQCFLSESGGESLSGDGLSQLFEGVRSTEIGSWEDPAEDTMVGVVNTSEGSYLLLNGLWESSNFYAQIFIDLVESMPNTEPYLSIKKSIRSILVLSDKSIEVACLERYQRGNDSPLSTWDFNSYISCGHADVYSFSKCDLNKLGVDEKDLLPFLIERSDSSTIKNEEFGNSSLERKPIYLTESGKYILALPTAISVALRLYVIEELDKLGKLHQMRQKLQYRYATFFGKDSKMLGEIGPIPFSPVRDSKGEIVGGDAIVGIDNHRYVHFIMFFDGFDGYESGFANSVQNIDVDLEYAISERIKAAYEYSIQLDGFQSGLSVLIGCGWGRSVSVSLESVSELERWKLEFVSAPDLDTFNRITSMNPLIFWRLVEAKCRSREAGVATQNVNGLLNLYGWARENDFNIIPHSAFEDDFTGSSLFMMITQNALLDVRWEVQRESDIHKVLNPYNEFTSVRRLITGSYFEEDRFKPIYGSVDNLDKGELLGLIKGEVCSWWCAPVIVENQNRDLLYRLWSAICNWIYKADSALSGLKYSSKHKNVFLRVEFEDIDVPDRACQKLDQEGLDRLIELTAYEQDGYLNIDCLFKENYLLAFHRPDNVAERHIVRTVLDAFVKASMKCGEHEGLVETIIGCIFLDNYAKEVHLLTAQNFLDYVKPSLQKPLSLDRFDDATIKIGMAWIASTHTEPCNIYGKSECAKYLRELNFNLWKEIKIFLRSFNKKAIILFLLENYAAIEGDIDHWQRTLKAMLGLHRDKDNVYSVALGRISSNNSVLTGSRILVEMAICESLDIGGELPNELDVTRLISYATAIFSYGNLSDSIMYDLVKPQLRLSTYGDVQFDHAAYDSIVNPYGKSVQKVIVNHASDKYDDSFDEPTVHEKVAGLLEPDFEHSWREEFGISIDEVREIVDLFENIGIDRNRAVYEIPYDDLISHPRSTGVSKTALDNFVNRFALAQRECWTMIPPGFRVSDISPWRYGRRLSLTAKPLIKIGNNLVISPSLIRRSVHYCLYNSHSGTLDGSFFNTNAMKKWVGKQRNISGHKFNKEAADKIREYGWEVEADVKVSKILRKKMEKDYGDVDVLAWNPEKKIIYLVECKDLEFAKTEGEVAKQVYEFKGVVRNDGRPDRLKKHLDRYQVLSENLGGLSDYLKVDEIEELRVMLLFKQTVPVSCEDVDVSIPFSVQFFDKLAV